MRIKAKTQALPVTWKHTELLFWELFTLSVLLLASTNLFFCQQIQPIVHDSALYVLASQIASAFRPDCNYH